MWFHNAGGNGLQELISILINIWMFQAIPEILIFRVHWVPNMWSWRDPRLPGWHLQTWESVSGWEKQGGCNDRRSPPPNKELYCTNADINRFTKPVYTVPSIDVDNTILNDLTNVLELFLSLNGRLWILELVCVRWCARACVSPFNLEGLAAQNCLRTALLFTKQKDRFTFPQES